MRSTHFTFRGREGLREGIGGHRKTNKSELILKFLWLVLAHFGTFLFYLSSSGSFSVLRLPIAGLDVLESRGQVHFCSLGHPV